MRKAPAKDGPKSWLYAVLGLNQWVYKGCQVSTLPDYVGLKPKDPNIHTPFDNDHQPSQGGELFFSW